MKVIPVDFIFRYIDGHFYLIVGSKNVHMMIREESNIDLYTESKYEYAKVSSHQAF